MQLIVFRTYAICDRKPYSCVAVIHELPQMRVIFCVSPGFIYDFYGSISEKMIVSVIKMESTLNINIML